MAAPGEVIGFVTGLPKCRHFTLEKFFQAPPEQPFKSRIRMMPQFPRASFGSNYDFDGRADLLKDWRPEIGLDIGSFDRDDESVVDA